MDSLSPYPSPLGLWSRFIFNFAYWVIFVSIKIYYKKYIYQIFPKTNIIYLIREGEFRLRLDKIGNSTKQINIIIKLLKIVDDYFNCLIFNLLYTFLINLFK